MGKESKKRMNMCVNIYIVIYMDTQLNHHAVHLKLTQHCKSTILQ